VGACGCAGDSDPVSLALCLAPPPGDHEVSIPLPGGRSLVLNDEGLFIRVIHLDDTLPFAQTITRRVKPESLESIGARVDPRDLLCQAVRGLVEAAESGSLRAREKLERCRGLVEELLRGC